MGVGHISFFTKTHSTKKADRRGATTAGPLFMNTVCETKDNAPAQLVNTCSDGKCLLERSRPRQSRRSVFNNGSISFHTFSSRDAITMFVFNQSIGLPMSWRVPRTTTPWIVSPRSSNIRSASVN